MKSKLYICIGILLTCFLFSCEQETTEILQPEQRVTSKIEATHADHYDLTKALIFFDSNAKKSLTTSLEGGDYLETAFGTAFLGKALKVSDGTNEGVLTFKILPKDYEENTFYNLVLYPEDTNGGQKAFIYKYVRDTSYLSYEEQKEKGFVGQRFKYPFDVSLVDIKGGDCPPDDVDIPDPIGDTGNDGDGNNGGGGSNTGGGTTGDGGTNTSGAQICITMTTFVQCCGSNRFTPHAAGQCGCASNPTGSYYVTIIECSGGDNNRSSKTICPGSDGDPIGVDDIPLHQLSLLELLKSYIGSTEITWIKDFNNDSLTRKIFDYIRDNNFSTRSKETAAKIVKILSGVNSINIFTQKHEFKSFMGIISDRIGRQPIGYNHPEMGQRFDRLNLSEALAQADLDILSIEDWRIMAQNALTLRHNLQYWDGNDARMKEIVKSASTIVLLPHVKTLTQHDSFFPQTAEEWRALGELMTPFLIEIGLSAIPGSDIVDVVQGIQNNDYVAVTLGLAGLTTDLFGARLVRVIAKFGESAYKTFKIIRVIGRSLNNVADVIRKGFKFDVDAGDVVLRAPCAGRTSTPCPIIAKGDEVGRISNHIVAELPLAGTRGGVSVERLSQFRNLPGRASGNGKNISGTWLRGSEGQAGFFPKSIADKMRNKNYDNFNKFREDFWKNVADDSNLSGQFSSQNVARMRNGLAPKVRNTQNLGGQTTYQIHHYTPINQGGDVYNFDNLTIVTPRYHKDILLPDYHRGYGY